MIFLDRSVVIEDGQLGAGLDMEVVGGAGVVVVVDDGGQEDTEYLQVRQPGLHRSHLAQLRQPGGFSLTLRPAWEMNQ